MYRCYVLWRYILCRPKSFELREIGIHLNRRLCVWRILEDHLHTVNRQFSKALLMIKFVRNLSTVLPLARISHQGRDRRVAFHSRPLRAGQALLW